MNTNIKTIRMSLFASFSYIIIASGIHWSVDKLKPKKLK